MTCASIASLSANPPLDVKVCVSVLGHRADFTPGDIAAIVAVIIAAVTLVVTARWYGRVLRKERGALMSALVAEIWTNLDLAAGSLIQPDEEEQVRSHLNEVLRMYRDEAEHPRTPPDNKSAADELVRPYRGRLGRESSDTGSFRHLLMEMHTTAIGQVLASGKLVGVLSPTVFVQLGHLFFSLQRHNMTVRRYNADSVKSRRETRYESSEALHNALGLGEEDWGLRNVQAAYVYWVHFRLQTTLIDIALDPYASTQVCHRSVIDDLRRKCGKLWPEYPRRARSASLGVRLRFLRQHAHRVLGDESPESLKHKQRESS